MGTLRFAGRLATNSSKEMTMQKRELGRGDLQVSAIGFGSWASTSTAGPRSLSKQASTSFAARSGVGLPSSTPPSSTGRYQRRDRRWGPPSVPWRAQGELF